MESLEKFSFSVSFCWLEVDIKEKHFLWEKFFPWFLRRCFFSPLMGVSGGLWQFCQQDPLQEWYDPLPILTHKRRGPSKECKIEKITQCVFFSQKAGGEIFMFKKVFVSFSSKGTFLKIKPKLFVCLMIIQTLALVKELSTIHKPSHVVIFCLPPVGTLCFAFAWYTPPFLKSVFKFEPRTKKNRRPLLSSQY